MLGRVLGRRHWWDAIDPQILLGAIPLRSDVAKMAEQGVTAVVNMCKEYPGPIDEYRQHQIEQLWLPTIDFNPPTIEHIREGVDFIERQIQRGGKVYIHCKAGRARSATVALCYLVRFRAMSPKQAQEHLIAHRPHVHPTIDQREVVKRYVEEISP